MSGRFPGRQLAERVAFAPCPPCPHFLPHLSTHFCSSLALFFPLTPLINSLLAASLIDSRLRTQDLVSSRRGPYTSSSHNTSTGYCSHSNAAGAVR